MGLPGSHSYGLTLTAENVPAGAAAVLVERAKTNLPEDLVATGTLRGSVRIDGNAAAGSKLQFEGRGEIADFHLSSAANKAEIGPETIPFLLTAGDTAGRAHTVHKSSPAMGVPDGPHVELGPFPVAIGRAVAPTVRGWLNRGGYNISVAGEAEIAKALRATRLFGLAALQSTTEGSAQVNLQIAGSWAGRSNGTTSGFTGPQVTGVAKLRNVRIAIRGAAGPVEIASADMQLLSDEVRVEKLNAEAADTLWTGSLTMPRGCGTPVACQVHFVLNANQIALGGLSEWVRPSPKERPWYRVLESSPQAGPSFLASVRASGQVSADRLQVEGLAAMRVSAKVNLDSGKLEISELNSDFLGGKHRGQWQADFSVKPAVCRGSGSLTGVSLARLADAMENGGIAGTANTSYEITGPCSAGFWTSAEAALQFEIRDGTLPHVAIGEDAEGLRVARFAGQARLQAGKIELKDAQLNSPEGKFLVGGTASLKGDLDFRLARVPASPAAVGYTISGTLAEPHVIRSSSPETQARLKTDPAK
jgi:hypothetical protein